MSDSSRRPGPESTLTQVRGRLIESGLELLQDRGVDIGLAHLTLTDAIDAAGVSRSSAYRSLADDEHPPQAVLRREVLSRILSRRTREANRRLVDAALVDELEQQKPNLESGDVAVRTRALRALMRVGAVTSYTEVATSTERSILTASYGALRSAGVTDWRHEHLVDGEKVLATLFAELYTRMSTQFGYRLKRGMSVLDFSTAIAASVEGIAMRHGVSDHVEGIERPTGIDGALEEWTLFGIVFEGIYTMFFEPSDDPPFADLVRY